MVYGTRCNILIFSKATAMAKQRNIVDIVIFIAVMLFAFFFPHVGLVPFPFGYCIPVLLVIWLALKRTKERFVDIGFSIRKLSRKAIITGCFIGVLLFAFLQYALFPLLSKLVYLPKANLQDFSNIRHHLLNYLFILVMGWVVGGVYEEVVFHGYIFSRFQKLFRKRSALPAALILTNIIFGLYHFQLGVAGMLNALLAGLVYNALMVRYNNIWYAVFCHAMFDTIGLTFIYLGYW